MENSHNNCCPSKSKSKNDYFLIYTSFIITIFYLNNFIELLYSVQYISTLSQSVFSLVNKMWWGLLFGIFFVGLLSNIPRELIMSVLGNKGTFRKIIRATLGGLLLDVCSHGILLIGMKLYERGASIGQVMAFLIASPWNSLTLILILWSLIGLKWTLAFIFLSLIIAIISGLIFELLVNKGVLPSNPNKTDISENYKIIPELKSFILSSNLSFKSPFLVIYRGLKDSKMILKWLFLGIIIASLLRTFVAADHFGHIFGPTFAGLTMTIFVATIIEVCSEGSTPIASDIFTRARAPGNSFAFLMTGVSTDYTEIMGLKETTKSWKISFFLPLVTLPQTLIISIIINNLS